MLLGAAARSRCGLKSCTDVDAAPLTSMRGCICATSCTLKAISVIIGCFSHARTHARTGIYIYIEREGASRLTSNFSFAHSSHMLSTCMIFNRLYLCGEGCAAILVLAGLLSPADQPLMTGISWVLGGLTARPSCLRTLLLLLLLLSVSRLSCFWCPRKLRRRLTRRSTREVKVATRRLSGSGRCLVPR